MPRLVERGTIGSRYLDDPHSLPLEIISVGLFCAPALVATSSRLAKSTRPVTAPASASAKMMISRVTAIPRADAEADALRIRERGCFLVAQTLWVEKFSQQPMLDR